MTELRSDSRIYVAGHTGLAGSAILRKLEVEGFENIITRSHADLDLTDQRAVFDFYESERPEYVFLAAAKVGGILANNTLPADFIRDNLLIQTFSIEAAHRAGVRKFLFLGSSCIYPKLARQPMKEEYLLSGPLEPTNEPYAVAKIAGITMLQSYARQYGFNGICLMPTNLYGPEDNFDIERSHVLAALLRRFHEARLANAPSVVVWGSGEPRREFLHVDDLADAALFLMKSYNSPEIVNVGVGKDIAIAELARLIAGVVGYGGAIEFDRTKPDGTPVKLLDISRLRSMGWEADIGLRDGTAQTYDWYRDNEARVRK
jgi:GDP-L-fucose synthase